MPKSILLLVFLLSSLFADYRVKSSQNILALSWHNAFCESHRYKKECKRDVQSFLRFKSHDSQFVLHGLWPQAKNKIYCHVDKALIQIDKNRQWQNLPCLAMDINIENSLKKVMAGVASGLHKHEWIKHGTCYGTNINSYFSDAIVLTNQVNHSALGNFFRQNIGKTISLKSLRKVANTSLGKGTGEHIELRCKAGLVTELWLHLGSGSTDLGKLLQKGKKIRSQCKQGRIDKAGFGR